MKPLVAFAALLAGCASTSDSHSKLWSVQQIKSHAWALDGQTVLVKGWIPYCRGRVCLILDSKIDANTYNAAPEQFPSLSIGYDAHFDAALEEEVPARVTFEARVNAACIDPKVTGPPDGPKDIIVCADRAPELLPVKIVNVRRDR